MSVRWTIDKCKDWETLANDPLEQIITEAFIWTALSTGLGKSWSLSEDFAPEFYARVKLIEKLDGALVLVRGQSRDITWTDVEKRIGMTVNVSPVSRTAFLKERVVNQMNSDVALYKRERDKTAVPS